jgi:hypothetical protein
VSREAACWPKEKNVNSPKNDDVKAPSPVVMFLLSPLLGVYHFALAADYEFTCSIHTPEVEIFLVPPKKIEDLQPPH